MNGGRDERRDERSVCQRGGCMVVPGAVVSPGHTKRLSLLPCRAPHNSPCTLMRTWLRQMGLTLRLVAAEYLPVRSLRRQVWPAAYSDAPGPDHAAVPLAVCPFCFLGV